MNVRGSELYVIIYRIWRVGDGEVGGVENPHPGFALEFDLGDRRVPERVGFSLDIQRLVFELLTVFSGQDEKRVVVSVYLICHQTFVCVAFLEFKAVGVIFYIVLLGGFYVFQLKRTEQPFLAVVIRDAVC